MTEQFSNHLQDAIKANQDHADEWPLKCNAHSELPAIAQCISCGNFVCHKCQRVTHKSHSKCPTCSGLPNQIPSPWEDPDSPHSLWEGFKKTVSTIILRPAPFFATLQPRGYMVMATFFAFLCLTTGNLMNTGWNILFRSEFLVVFEQMQQELGLNMYFFPLMVMLLTPFAAIFQLIAISSLLQLGLGLLGTPNKGFAATFRIAAYGSATHLLFIIPIIGSVIGTFMAIIVHIHGLRNVHKITFGRAAFATMIPWLLLGLTGIV